MNNDNGLGQGNPPLGAPPQDDFDLNTEQPPQFGNRLAYTYLSPQDYSMPHATHGNFQTAAHEVRHTRRDQCEGHRMERPPEGSRRIFNWAVVYTMTDIQETDSALGEDNDWVDIDLFKTTPQVSGRPNREQQQTLAQAGYNPSFRRANHDCADPYIVQQIAQRIEQNVARHQNENRANMRVLVHHYDDKPPCHSCYPSIAYTAQHYGVEEWTVFINNRFENLLTLPPSDEVALQRHDDVQPYAVINAQGIALPNRGLVVRPGFSGMLYESLQANLRTKIAAQQHSCQTFSQVIQSAKTDVAALEALQQNLNTEQTEEATLSDIKEVIATLNLPACLGDDATVRDLNKEALSTVQNFKTKIEGTIEKIDRAIENEEIQKLKGLLRGLRKQLSVIIDKATEKKTNADNQATRFEEELLQTIRWDALETGAFDAQRTQFQTEATAYQAVEQTHQAICTLPSRLGDNIIEPSMRNQETQTDLFNVAALLPNFQPKNDD